jgi:hypothetical protein
MIKLTICAECGRLLTDAAELIRRHEADLTLGLRLNAQSYLTEETRQQLAPGVVGSFNAAQAAWDAYREHLIEHGLLEPEAKTAKLKA